MFNFKKLSIDLRSGFSVFLIALPLSLGIAMASQFPPIAGVLSAIVGGIVCTFMGSSKLTIKGPAAGLIVIVLGAVTELGQGDLLLGYKKALAVGAVSGIFQVVIAIVGLAEFAEIMPLAVIHGLLAAIGLIIISKQIHVIFGVMPVGKEPFELYSEIPHSFMNMNPKIFLIGALCFLIVYLWPKFKLGAKYIPATLIVMFVAIFLSVGMNIGMGDHYQFWGRDYSTSANFLISLPAHFLDVITFPDFSSIFSFTSLKYIIMFTLVGSIESLLTVCAVDDLDPDKKASDLNKDLISLGLGNFVASFIGGLPMISEIVRSRANIDYGAKTSASNFFHGLFLLISIIIFPGILQKIPFAALAAVLIFTGMRLASYHEFKKYYSIGKDQFFLFITTVILTLTTDILVAVFVGGLLKIGLHMYRGATMKSLIHLDHQEKIMEKELVISISGPVIFTVYHELKMTIIKNTNVGKKIILNFEKTTILDHTVQEKLFKFLEEFQPSQLEVVGLQNLKSISGHEHGVKLKNAA